MELSLHFNKMRQNTDLRPAYEKLSELQHDKHSIRKVLRALVPVTQTGSLEEAADLLEEMIDCGVVTIR